MTVFASGKIEAYVGPTELGAADDLESVISEFIAGARSALAVAVQELDNPVIAQALLSEILFEETNSRTSPEAAGQVVSELSRGLSGRALVHQTGLLAVYVHLSGSFGSVYGPLAGVFALLLWALLSSIAFFYGTAVCAQLEALRAGEPAPALDDPGRPHARTVGDRPSEDNAMS